MTLRFHVDGVPVPQGSMRAFVTHGHAVVTHKRPAELGAWRQAVAARAREAGAVPVRGPVSVSLHFHLVRPKSVSKRVLYPAVRPDLDKYCRSVLDALTGIAWEDDGQVVSLTATKGYALPWVPLMPGPTLGLDAEVLAL